MTHLKNYIFVVLLSVINCQGLFAQVEVSGQVIDAETEEVMAFANIQVVNTKAVVTSDSLGRFKIRVSHPTDTLAISFMGYDLRKLSAAEVMNTYLIKLTSSTTTLKEVEILGEKSSVIQQFESIRPGKQVLKKETVLALPALAGEPDFIKALTLLPGTTKGVEGSSDFFVRGGDADQNLVLMDGATVYNTGHLFGFLSVFNPSAIGEVNMLTGGFPAEYGGRLSSIIDIRTKQLNADRTFIEGGIGLISSRIAVEHPVIKDKLAIQVAGRRTYADQVVKLAGISLP
ncbi:MAG: carboxypeptidase-like regulatory domain-containing protein, partial [Fulvivirga sp.]|uniref:carboxypeptidase-like regulatory domain-containing protein n=1 Tax=Fulvivirga sp. TaxID=1931237 RepID=UPI0032EB3975